MKGRAAVLVELGKPLQLVDLEMPELKPGQVLVRLAFSGVCHTQLLEARGHRGPDVFLPHCLGHEGSGTVEKASPGVTKVRAGDNVILSWIRGLGINVPGAMYQWNGRTVNAGAVTTFNQLAVVSENRLMPIPAKVGLREAALLGCAVPTGMGLVFNTAKVRRNETVAVIGLGGVGLCAVAAARLAGAAGVFAIDPRADRREAAKAFGATATATPAEADELIRRTLPNGLDATIEASGRPDAMKLALALARPRGGRAAVAGNARNGEFLTLDPRELNAGKSLLGSWGGDSEPDRDFPRYAAHVADGSLDLKPLLHSVYSLAQVNEALADLESGRALRPLLDLNA